MELSEIFVSSCLAWESEIPESLRYENRRILYQILKLAGPEEGINQTDLRSALGVSQPRLSQIKAKLVGKKWVKVWRSEKDSRQLLMTITPAARHFINAFELKFAAAVQPVRMPPRRAQGKPGSAQAGARDTLFDLMARTS